MKPTAKFIGFQQDVKGNKLPLFNVGKNTWCISTLKRRGIEIPKYPTISQSKDGKLKKGIRDR